MKKLISKDELKKSYRSLFVDCVFISMAVYLIISLFTLVRGISFVFFKENADMFMDFFNSVRDASLGVGAYTERHIIYPPMANLFFWLISFITPDSYNASSFDERYSWMEHPINIFIICVFVVLSAAALIFVLYKGLKTDKSDRRSRALLTLAMVFSVPFLNMLERGNIMTVAFIALMIYAVTYNSENKLIRELGVIALAFSFSIKLYPIIFSWIMFADKRYKEFFRCALYSVAFLVLPSFFFGGPQCLYWIFKNIVSFSGGSGNAMSFISGYLHIPYVIVSGVFYGIFIAAVICFVISPWIFKERWKIWALGCIAFITYPALSSTYAWALFIIPIMFYLNDGHDRCLRRDNMGRKYLIPILIPFLFLPVPMTDIAMLINPAIDYKLPVTANAIAVYIMIVVLAAVAVYDTVKTLSNIKRRKRA